MRLSQPWPDGFTVNARSPFGWRRHPVTGKKRFHNGIDVAVPVGTQLVAPADGVVVHKGSGGSGGVTLILKHAADLFTVYYHLQKPSHLNVGDRVQTGQPIAFSGNTGLSTGPHLHWEVRRTQRGNQVDPIPFLQGAPSVQPAPVAVSGRLDKATWMALQGALKRRELYPGVIDGKPGPMTYRALQAFLGVKMTGQFDDATKRALQGRLGVKQDGVFGRLSVSALQRALNDGTI